MKVLIFGATGMVGRGVLRECLLDTAIDAVVAIGRSATGLRHAKLRENLRADLFDYTQIENDLRGFDAGFFCLGVSSAGVPAAEYQRLTYDLTLATAETLARLNPAMTFIYVSGAGTDSSEQGRMAWARVKGRTENALLRLPFKAAYMFRPGVIQAAHGERPKARATRIAYAAMGWTLPLLRRMFPTQILTTEQMGRAMIEAAGHGFPKPILEVADIAACARGSGPL